MTSTNDLAIYGGDPVRSKPMPARYAVGPSERKMVSDVFDHYDRLGLDPGYQGYFEEQYCNAFSKYQGGGYADAVATGTISIYVAIKALELPPESEILVSPITDAGSLSAIIESGHRPKLMDAARGSYNADAVSIENCLDDKVKAVLLVHATGKAANIDAISKLTKDRNIKLIEDCSQSHGASSNGVKIGCFGDVAAFSTMYRKCSIAGGSGGVVYTRDQDIFHMSLAHADRGKPSWRKDFDYRDPSEFLFPALNMHTDEISCAIGIPSLARLDETRKKRLNYIQKVAQGLNDHSRVCQAQMFGDEDSPFICPVFVNTDRIKCTKLEFAEAIRAEGIDLNPHYKYLVRDWPWLRSYLADEQDTPVAREMRDTSFCLYLNENYGQQEIEDTLNAFMRVEAYFINT